MRLHQSWWRTFRLRVPFGTGPQKGSEKAYGNMIDADGDVAGLNFLSHEAQDAYDQRVAVTTAGVEAFRTRRHLMASQPLAFNLFGHLSKHLDLATGLLRLLLGTDEVGEVTSIEIERLSASLGDRTAFDLFATYTRPGGSSACIAIETKLTNRSPSTTTTGRRTSPTRRDPTVWRTTDTACLGDRRWSQLWRSHLLARAESNPHPELGPAILLVIHHPSDQHCRTNVDGYCRLLTSPETVQAIDLQQIRDVLADVIAGDDSQQRWVGNSPIGTWTSASPDRSSDSPTWHQSQHDRFPQCTQRCNWRV